MIELHNLQESNKEYLNRPIKYLTNEEKYDIINSYYKDRDEEDLLDDLEYQDK